MLERTVHANGVVTYQSPLLREAGVRHAFSTRTGGVSEGPFASLNLGNPGGEVLQDAAEHIRENYRRLQEAIGCDERVLRAWVRQVHGRAVELIEREPENEYAETLEAEIRDRFSGQVAADAMVSAVSGVLLMIRVADCVPILLGSADGKIVAGVHAGWRGVVGNVVAKAVRVMQEAGAGKGIVAAIGPAISVEHFEVGAEVAEEFVKHDLANAVRAVAGGKPHIDLQLAVRLQLERAGVRRVEGNDLCTFRDAGDFYSHRRDAGVTGRMAAVISAR